MYGNCGSLDDAKAVFDRIHSPDLYSWHILMKAYGQNGYVDDAYVTFSHMPSRNDVSWNTMISAFAQNGHGKEALELFRRMQLNEVNPSKVTFVSLFDACASLKDSREGMGILSFMIIIGNIVDMVVGTALINMFGKCGAVPEAKDVFEKLVDRDIVTWTAMIATFSQNGYGKDALSCFSQMQETGFMPDTASFACAIDACATLGDLKRGQSVHISVIDIGFENRVPVGNALINMYGKCKSLYDAITVFYNMCNEDVVSWTAIIGACTQNSNGKEALRFYHQMRFEGILPNKVTLLCVLDACAILVAIGSAQEIHSTISICNSEYDDEAIMMGNALINVYGKCGSLPDARRVFNTMPKKDVVCWTSIIATLAQSGHVDEALGLFKQMAHEGIKPNDATFVCVLNACSHSGHINAAMKFFLSMKKDHEIEYKIDHYVCMVDLLGRAGHLNAAEDLIAQMPVEKANVAWLCLLGACRIHGDTVRASHAASHCDELDPNDITPFLTLSNTLSTTMHDALPLQYWSSEVLKKTLPLLNEYV